MEGTCISLILLHILEGKKTVVSYASAQPCIMQKVSVTEQGNCQQGDEVQQCSVASATVE